MGKFGASKKISSGASRFKKMTPEERSTEARRASEARWAKVRLEAAQSRKFEELIDKLDDGRSKEG